MFAFLSCKNVANIFNNDRQDIFTNQLDEKRNGYAIKMKIVKIKQTKTTYKIYARYKNDSEKILIISNKKINKNCNNKIKVGRVYELDLKTLIPQVFIRGVSLVPEPPWGETYFVHQIPDLEGNFLEYRREKGVLFDVFMSPQLKGLCYELK